MAIAGEVGWGLAVFWEKGQASYLPTTNTHDAPSFHSYHLKTFCCSCWLLINSFYNFPIIIKSYNGIGAEGAKTIGSALPILTALTTLNLNF